MDANFHNFILMILSKENASYSHPTFLLHTGYPYIHQQHHLKQRVLHLICQKTIYWKCMVNSMVSVIVSSFASLLYLFF